MSDTVIRVENLGKKYIIGHQKKEQYSTLRDVVAGGARSLGERLTGKNSADPTREEFWALKDVSFEVKQGDRVGIIGRNGAGKSTLLKILSRITEPTTGRIEVKGRIASLLEVGTGFHQELTGRENIFLNGSILGMGKTEIQKQFDAIVDFAEIEQFLDTPVKRYSSGMRVRLGFAVAAHLTPEILIVDEVLAVGDVAFQNKCLGKMEDVSQNEGRTVLFVSHNMSVVEQLCNRGIVLKQGKLAVDESTENSVNYYLKSAEEKTAIQPDFRKFSDKHQIGLASPTVKLVQKDSTYHDLEISVIVESRRAQKGLGVSVNIATQTGQKVAHIGPRLHRKMLPSAEGSLQFITRFSDIDKFLSGGIYFVSLKLLRPKIGCIVALEEALSFTIPARVLYQDGAPYTCKEFGPVVLSPETSIESIEARTCADVN